jgi:tungstate transport system permease protein
VRHDAQPAVARRWCAIEYVIEMLRQGFTLVNGRDPSLSMLFDNTVSIAFWATLIALVVGLPIAFWIGSANTKPRRIARTVANAGLGLPPVGVGVYWVLLQPPSIPYLPHTFGAYLGQVQAVLSLPIVVALCATAFLRLPSGLVDQARAFGASGWRLAIFMLREAKVGVIAAVIVALGAAIGEVGAITIVASGGGISPTGTMATKILYLASTGEDPFMVELAIAIVAMLLVLGVVLTIVQQWDGRWLRQRRATTGPVLPQEASP